MPLGCCGSVVACRQCGGGKQLIRCIGDDGIGQFGLAGTAMADALSGGVEGGAESGRRCTQSGEVAGGRQVAQPPVGAQPPGQRGGLGGQVGGGGHGGRLRDQLMRASRQPIEHSLDRHAHRGQRPTVLDLVAQHQDPDVELSSCAGGQCRAVPLGHRDGFRVRGAPGAVVPRQTEQTFGRQQSGRDGATDRHPGEHPVPEHRGCPGLPLGGQWRRQAHRGGGCPLGAPQTGELDIERHRRQRSGQRVARTRGTEHREPRVDLVVELARQSRRNGFLTRRWCDDDVSGCRQPLPNSGDTVAIQPVTGQRGRRVGHRI